MEMSVDKLFPEWYIIKEISGEDFLKSVKPIFSVIEDTHKSKSNEDPFIKSVVTGHTDMTDSDWARAEKVRLTQKALEMKIGNFHQELMGKFPGYVTFATGHHTGCDVGSVDETTLIEVKNRDNTVKGSDGKHLVAMLKEHADKGKNVILVQVNCTGDKVKRFNAHPSVKVFTGKEMYTYLSKRDTFFEDLQANMRYVFLQFKTYNELKHALETV